jgi:hypothetical protein
MIYEAPKELPASSADMRVYPHVFLTPSGSQEPGELTEHRSIWTQRMPTLPVSVAGICTVHCTVYIFPSMMQDILLCSQYQK